jgi:L-lactate dehydrogenase complex protein LldF
MLATSNEFRANARVGLANPTLQSALGKMKVGFPTKRAEAVAKLPEFDALRDQARDIKNHVLENIDWYLERRARSCSASAGASARARSPRASR